MISFFVCSRAFRFLPLYHIAPFGCFTRCVALPFIALASYVQSVPERLAFHNGDDAPFFCSYANYYLSPRNAPGFSVY